MPDRAYLLAVCFLFKICLLQAQVSTPPSKDSTAFFNQPEEKSFLKKIFSPQKSVSVQDLILEGSFIAYGIATLGQEELQDWNQTVKYELWTEHPHGRFPIDDYLQWSPAAAVYVLNLAGIKGRHNFADRTIIYGISTLIMGATVNVSKHLFREERPDGSNNLSFPSGHTATAFAAAEFLRTEYRDVSPWYGIAGYAVAATTGFYRMYNNKHWLNDIVAGAGVGILSTRLAYAIYPLLKKQQSGKVLKTAYMPFYQNSAAGISLLHWF